jgi:hypothetical protein
MPMDMGIGQIGNACIKRKFRWLLIIPEVSSDTPINSLPPAKSARPNLTFKPMEIQHINETIYRPSKPDWKPITLTLYDLKRNKHPVFSWLKKQYNPFSGAWKSPEPNQFVLAQVYLELYDGCGFTVETWVYENVWIEEVDFEDLDMNSSDVVMCTLTLRYDRAYIKDEGYSPSSENAAAFGGFESSGGNTTPNMGIDDSFISNRGRGIV